MSVVLLDLFPERRQAVLASMSRVSKLFLFLRNLSVSYSGNYLFEKVLSVPLREFCQITEILPDSQFGFRPNRLTIDPLIALQTDLTRFHNFGQCTVAAFLDRERAFDKFWHDGLLYKMHQLNFVRDRNRITSVKVTKSRI